MPMELSIVIAEFSTQPLYDNRNIANHDRCHFFQNNINLKNVFIAIMRQSYYIVMNNRRNLACSDQHILFCNNSY